jgi:hypothetical protein
MKTIYPFVGDSDYSNQFNLKNPVNTDSGFRLSFSGDWVYTTIGIKPNGVNTFANTFLNPSTSITSTTYFGMYMRTPELSATTSIDGGVISGTSLWLSPYYTGSTNQGINTSVELTSPSTGLTYGYFHVNKTGTTSQLYYDNNLLTSTTDSGGLPNSTVYLGAVNSGGTPTEYSKREIALTIISEGLSNNKVIELNDIVQLFIQECQKSAVVVSDPDAQNFINQASISNTTQADAVNTLVVGLKSFNLWSKMKTVYPFVGGNSFSHKFNLVNPLDDNSAYRLTFFGGWVHDNNGARANGVNSYANTYLQPSTKLTTTNYSYGGYSRNNQNGLGYNGCGTPNWFIHSFHSYNFTEFWSTNSTRILSAGTFGFLTNVKDNNDKYIYRNGSLLVSGSAVESTLPNNTFYIGAANNGTPTFYDNKQLAFYYISDKLTSTEVSDFNSLVQQFQTTLNRQV